jgi:hypothetical protein
MSVRLGISGPGAFSAAHAIVEAASKWKSHGLERE